MSNPECEVCGAKLVRRICFECHGENDPCPGCFGEGTVIVCPAAPHTDEEMAAWMERERKRLAE